MIKKYSVNFYANGQYIGNITLGDGPIKFVLNPPDSPHLRSILEDPVSVVAGRRLEKIYPYDDPVRWMDGLITRYKSQALLATNVGNDGGAPMAIDVIGHAHKGKGTAQGGQFTPKGVGEGDIASPAPVSAEKRRTNQEVLQPTRPRMKMSSDVPTKAEKAAQAQQAAQTQNSITTEELVNLTPQQLELVISGRATEPAAYQQKGMDTIEEMRVIKVGHQNFVYGVGREKVVVQSLSLMKNIPKTLHESTHTIVFTTQQNSEDGYWAKRYNIPNFKSRATGGGGKITVYNNGLMPSDTYAHECGHNLAAKVWGTVYPPKDSPYAAAQSVEGPVSSYGAASPAEDFAEACSWYAGYVPNPLPGSPHTPESARVFFEQAFPVKYAVIKAMIGE